MSMSPETQIRSRVVDILGLPSTEEARESARNLIRYVESLNGIENNYVQDSLLHPDLAARAASKKLSYVEGSLRNGEITPEELVKHVHSIDRKVYLKLKEGKICGVATSAAHRLWITIRKPNSLLPTI